MAMILRDILDVDRINSCKDVKVFYDIHSLSFVLHSSNIVCRESIILHLQLKASEMDKSI